MVSFASILVLFALNPPTQPQVQEALQAVLQERAYQTELPHTSLPPEAAAPRELDLPGFSVPLRFLARILLWVGVGICVVLLAGWLYQLWSGTSWQKDPASMGLAAATGPAPAAAVLDDAEKLARQGLFTEAVRMLLLRAFQDLNQSLARPVPASHTSREVLQHTDLQAQSRDWLRLLIQAVEIGHFGGRTLQAQDFAAAREHFQRFQQSRETRP